MKKRNFAVFILAFSVMAAAMTGAQAQSLYAPDQYPTAQGKYLQAPNTDQPSTLSSPLHVMPPQPAMSAPQTVAAAPMPPAAVVPPVPAPVLAAPVYTPAPASVAAPGPVPVQSQTAAPTSYGSMPSYTYNSAMDPAHPPYKTPIAHDPKTTGSSGIGLGAITGFEVGVEVSDYRYQEFAPSGSRLIRITGPTVGIMGDYTKAYKDGWFFSGDLRVSYGLHDYTGGDEDQFGNITPSTHNGIDDWMFDIRALGGHDFLFEDAFWGLTDVDLSPYAGLGFRYLFDDSRGDDSNGVEGYERYSHYFYLPIGVTPRFRLTENSRLSVNMEYDLLLTGWQVSSLGDANPGESDITNTQTTGYGLRGSVMYERPKWSAGPFFEFWDIGQSHDACSNAACGYFEPHNQTYEFGVQGKYRF